MKKQALEAYQRATELDPLSQQTWENIVAPAQSGGKRNTEIYKQARKALDNLQPQ
jgi:hypothetical protein